MSIHYYLQKKDLKIIRKLIEEQSKENEVDLDKRTPLMLCSLENDEKWAIGVARMLLQAGAKTSLVDKDNRDALMYACLFDRLELFELLLRAVTFNLKRYDTYGNSSLHYAVLSENTAIIIKLIARMQKNDAISTFKNLMGNTAEELLRRNNNLHFILQLVKSSDEKDINSFKKKSSPRHFSSKNMMKIENLNEIRNRLIKEVKISAKNAHMNKIQKSLNKIGNSSCHQKTFDNDSILSYNQTRRYSDWRDTFLYVQDLVKIQIAASFRISAVSREEEHSDICESDNNDEFSSMKPKRQRSKSLYPGSVVDGNKSRLRNRRESSHPGQQIRRNNLRESELEDVIGLMAKNGKIRNKRRESVDVSSLKNSLVKNGRRNPLFESHLKLDNSPNDEESNEAHNKKQSSLRALDAIDEAGTNETFNSAD